MTIGFSFESDWLREWREYFGPVTERSEAKPKQSQMYLRHWIENCSWSNNTLVKWNLRANALNLFETISYVWLCCYVYLCFFYSHFIIANRRAFVKYTVE